ncbi:hypothetical protein B0H11DRAFT_2264659 [Mycena galericulata]|nr:hypothetical protein B0H11DRAFT_2264659 [Mycena galericulata]
MSSPPPARRTRSRAQAAASEPAPPPMPPPPRKSKRKTPAKSAAQDELEDPRDDNPHPSKRARNSKQPTATSKEVTQESGASATRGRQTSRAPPPATCPQPRRQQGRRERDPLNDDVRRFRAASVPAKTRPVTPASPRSPSLERGRIPRSPTPYASDHHNEELAEVDAQIARLTAMQTSTDQDDGEEQAGQQFGGKEDEEEEQANGGEEEQANGEEEQANGEEEQQANGGEEQRSDDEPPQILESEDSDPDDDYEAAQRVKEREFQRLKRRHPSATRTEDEDEEETEDFERELDGKERGGTRVRKAQSAKKKEKEKEKKKKGGGRKNTEEEEREAGDDGGDEGTDNQARCSGPMSAECKKDADALWTQFLQAVNDLAEQHGKTPQSIHQYIGSINRARREKSGWNLFQTWYTSPTGGGMTKPSDMPPQDWTQQVGDEYHKRLHEAGLNPDDKHTTADVLQALPWLKKYAEEQREAIVEFRIDQGAFAGDINKFCTLLTQLCTTGHTELGVHPFGWVIDTKAGQNRAFSGSEAVARLREHQGLDLKKTMKEYEHKIGMMEVNLKKVNAAGSTSDTGGVPPDTGGVSPATAWPSASKNRDLARQWVKDQLVQDQVQLERARDPEADVDASRYHMHWNWADHGFLKQFRIENWPDDMAAEGLFPSKNFAQTKFGNGDEPAK